jgi:putative oxidoreductase
MNFFARLITLNFLPRLVDFALLVFRIWLGASMFWLHGMTKLKGFGEYVTKFTAMGFPNYVAGAAVIAEGVFSVLLVIGLATRWAALFLATTMTVAFYKAHGAALTGEKNGELAFIYMAGFVLLFLAGPGRVSVDAKIAR